MILAAAVLMALCFAAMAGYVISLERGLRRARELLELHLRGDSGVRLDMPCPNRATEELLAAVNRLALRRQEENAEWRRQERALRRQIANVSHDLRTPLTSILGYVQLLEQEDLPPEKRAEYLSVVKGRARTLQAFIGAFYDLSRIEGGEWPLEREQIDLARILSDQLAGAYQQLEEAGLAVEASLPAGLPPVWGDRNAAARIFSNLLTNALRHGSGTLAVRLYREGDRVVSAFSNRAEEMTEEDAAHVFERFYTADKARNRESTGLGLAIVKALAGRMDCGCAARLENGLFTVELSWRV